MGGRTGSTGTDFEAPDHSKHDWAIDGFAVFLLLTAAPLCPSLKDMTWCTGVIQWAGLVEGEGGGGINA